MKKLLLLSFLLVSVLVQQAMAQGRAVSGKVTDATTNQPLPGVSVLVKGTTVGTATGVDGSFTLNVPEGGNTLVFRYISYKTEERAIGNNTTFNVALSTDAKQLSEVVVTALGVEREVRTVTYAAQEVQAEDLNITQGTNIKDALAGKVAGVQLNSQAGSKLGQFGKIRIRGAISLTSDADPLYIIDGVPTTNPNDVDMNNVESVNVLKGPNATSLYGQRAEAGVVVITTKKGASGLSVELDNSTTWDKVAYLPKYQNLYGRGYADGVGFGEFAFDPEAHPAEWEVFNGKRYIQWDDNYADESWGEKFDGQDYVPWYAWWPGTAEKPNPYFGKTQKYVAQPDNIKNFYETGLTQKNSVAISGGSDKFNARLSYTNLKQNGITPYSELNKHFVNTNFNFNATDKLSVTSNVRFTTSEVQGDQDDAYGNQTSGSFNSWFGREVETDKLKELKDLVNFDGNSVSWNWWGPDYYTFGGGYKKPAFWFNPYTFLERYDQIRTNNNVTGSLTAAYKFSDNWDLSVTGSRNATNYKFEEYFPFFLANSAAPELYNAWINGFGRTEITDSENNFSSMLKYNNKFGEFDVTAFVGGNIRKNDYQGFEARMQLDAKSGGLIIPDDYRFANAGVVPSPNTAFRKKQVNSLYGNVSLGFRDMLYIDGSLRKDWSSALPADKNGYAYPGIGASFIFTEMLGDNFEYLSFGKLRAGWAQVGNDVGANQINPAYRTSSQPFLGSDLLVWTPLTLVDPNIEPAKNTAFEAGFDLRFIDDRAGLSFTYYDEKRKNEIIPVSVSRTTGYGSYLTNAGQSSRKGIEVAVDGDIFKSTDGFNWNITMNYARNRTTVDALPKDLTAITAPGGGSAFGFVSVIHELGNNWGQIRGRGFARDEQGRFILDAESGYHETVANQYFGSVLPDFTGGVINRMSFKGLTLAAAVDFQKGGKFFSLTEMWGGYSGLTEETAAMNDRGKNIRDAVADGGGVHVTGVDANGETVDMYIEAVDYFSQFQANTIAEPFIHDASFIKLRDVSLSYDLTNVLKDGILKNNLIKGASIGVVGRNLWLISVSDDNKNRWDPSELAQTYGEDGQVPGTRSYGVNVKLTF
ncbi:SusC/RagA family TonB-linked outer membrane protein [Pontibacter fetidus]|uniref:SusC/RagA family TonB-linked outer membrane protein n=1 Tax=Pontibacter fetidus TaxID=2700082 RepID=A0A6B2H3D8_9BACT|nr:SusC/RagA family TonB-linked outer membrane protein [Pontibacter fetidus]NDK56863.1 SusC/RagA family TonB-linked outer membrane protein [Pontibacter fetidus]